MPTYPSKKRYDKKTLRKVLVSFNRNVEPELVEFIEGKENKSGYIKQLVREDYRKQQK